ncbi:ATP synthase F1 subcomplex epsilon subunit [Verrucomicrobium sp. GAS474]|uniref:ATP synthase F1 subunit epsilon n=1 Tax=Verrucomicrobium sp. GAS474 TaxID=1882831 RepID=UPI00087CF237|nr:ATP synthase F1 subunit epsilon [Verrucomicrobium sp. GAS474]SDT87362.1 ATP synthase F1 subcomplex epsilon subunit [Verrucomicrobium sp. GAS474]
MSDTLHLEIVTPDGRAFAGDVASVTLPGAEGDLGILPQHAPLLAALRPGELSYLPVEPGVGGPGREVFLAVGTGFAEVTGTTVSILTDMAVFPKDVNAEAAEAELKRAEEALRSRTLVGEELEATEASLARSTAQLHLIHTHKA